MKIRLFLSWLIVFFSFSFSLKTITIGQANPESVAFFVSQEGKLLTLHSVDSDLDISSVLSVPEFLIPLPYNGQIELEPSQALILSTESIVVSPNGENVAISARDETHEIVYVYSFDELLGAFESNVTAFASNSILWSPDSSKLAANSPQLELFDLDSRTLDTFFTDQNSRQHIFGTFNWLGNNQLLHVQSVFDSNTGRSHDDIYVLDLRTSKSSQITDLPNSPEWDFWQLKELENGHDGWDSVCAITWSSSVERAYFVVGCPSSSSDASLHSVDLEGNMRVELSLSTMYPDAISSAIYSLHSGSDAVLVFALVVVSSDTTDQRTTNTWRLFKVSDSAPPQMLYEDVTSTGIAHATISPDGNLVAFVEPTEIGKPELIRVMNVQSGEIITSPPIEKKFCRMQWLDEERLIFSVSNVICAPTATQRQLLVFDLNSLDFEPLNINPEFAVWLVPNQRTRLESLTRSETLWDIE